MAMIEGFFAAVGAAIAGFIGHLLAHDFAEITPSVSRKLIQWAARSLTKDDEVRYSEEWLADLNDHTGVFAKLGHAIGCLLCARRMRKQSQRETIRRRMIRFEFDGVGTIEFNAATGLFALEALLLVANARKSRWKRAYMLIGGYIFMAKVVLRQSARGAADYDKALRFITMLGESKAKNFKAYIDGELFVPPKERKKSKTD